MSLWHLEHLAIERKDRLAICDIYHISDYPLFHACEDCEYAFDGTPCKEYALVQLEKFVDALNDSQRDSNDGECLRDYEKELQEGQKRYATCNKYRLTDHPFYHDCENCLYNYDDSPCEERPFALYKKMLEDF